MLMNGKIILVGAGYAVQRDDGELIVFGGGPDCKMLARLCANGEMAEKDIAKAALYRGQGLISELMKVRAG